MPGLVVALCLMLASCAPSITSARLDRPNPVEYEFDAGVDAIHAAIREMYQQQFRDRVRNTFSPVFYTDDPLPPEAKAVLKPDDVFLWYMHLPIGDSAIYRVNGKPAPYLADFHLSLKRLSSFRTSVRITAVNPQILTGRSWKPGNHMVRPNIYQSVAPTTIEEYTLLLSLGRRLGLKDMPPLNLPEAR